MNSFVCSEKIAVYSGAPGDNLSERLLSCCINILQTDKFTLPLHSDLNVNICKWYWVAISSSVLIYLCYRFPKKKLLGTFFTKSKSRQRKTAIHKKTQLHIPRYNTPSAASGRRSYYPSHCRTASHIGKHKYHGVAVIQDHPQLARVKTAHSRAHSRVNTLSRPCTTAHVYEYPRPSEKFTILHFFLNLFSAFLPITSNFVKHN